MDNPKRKFFYIVSGMLAANVAGAALLGIAWLAGLALGKWVLFISYPSLFLVPMSMGVAAAFFWSRIGQGPWGDLLCSVATLALTLGGGYLFLKEGVVCLLIVSPLLFASFVAGAWVGRIWFRAPRNRLNLSLIPALLLLVAGEYVTRTDETASVTDEIIIRARPEKVWPHVTAFPAIPEPPDFWLFKMGLPSPSATTSSGNYIGAERKCIFSNGLVFNESVAEIVPNELLTFDIVEQPRDPELLGHLDLHRGQFILRDNGDGSTTLIGRSWYTLHVRPLWYFDPWTRTITREVHLRVMRHIKHLAEAAS